MEIYKAGKGKGNGEEPHYLTCILEGSLAAAENGD